MEINFSKIYKCECHSEALEIVDDSYDEKNPTLDLCIWRFGSPNGEKHSIGDRLRWCWRMITKGTLYTDDMILSKDTVDELIKDLQIWSNSKH